MPVFDIECDGITPTKIHCMSVQMGDKIVSYTNYEDMRQFLLNADELIGHNVCRYDLPVCERILGIKINCKKIVETLALSWYIYTDRVIHGLDEWGKFFGIEKPPIDDWENLPVEEYIHRCEEDVKINQRLWDMQLRYLQGLYKSDDGVAKLIHYLTFKMQCAALQEVSQWRLDVPKCQEGLDTLRHEKSLKQEQLQAIMPSVPVTVKRAKPKKMFKQDGTVSALALKWGALLNEHNLPEDYDGEVEVITGYKDPNSGSVQQVKAFLFGLGWAPNEYKHNRNKETGEIKKIEQINKQAPGAVGVTESVRKLFKATPGLEALDGLSILTHRIGILTGFLRDVNEDGYIQAQIKGLTNTLRFKHKVVVNLPGVHKPYGKLIRGCLIAPYGKELCGSDMSSLEDRTKQHYMWEYDPEYVKEMRTDDFDPHLDIGVEGKILTEDEVKFYKWYNNEKK